uniref:Cystatin domain-containing protein n=1 Tax=Canis lupus familiaris TaxID=9615 RepID=A0A8I3PVW7_CANLF
MTFPWMEKTLTYKRQICVVQDLTMAKCSPFLVTHGSRSGEGVDNNDQKTMEIFLSATVEYALHVFNLQSNDTKAYRLVRILDSRIEQEKKMMAFSMELQLKRTRCGKFDEDIDNCPFQSSSGQNNIITCFFTISTDPWNTIFELWNKTCLEGGSLR